MKRFVVAALAASFLVSSATAVDQVATTGTYAYTAVDEVATLTTTQLRIRGVLSGDPTATSVVFYATTYSTGSAEPLSDRCHRLALLAMTKPGQYVLTVTASSIYLQSCSLARATP